MLSTLGWEHQAGSPKGILFSWLLLFTKTSTADFEVVLPRLISRSICRFDEESDAMKAQPVMTHRTLLLSLLLLSVC